VARFSLFARYFDKLQQGLLRSVLERTLAVASIVIALFVQWRTGGLTDNTLIEKIAPEATIIWLFAAWHIFKACFLLDREIQVEIVSYAPTILVPGEPKRDPPDVVPHHRLKTLMIASLSFFTFCMATYLMWNTGRYISASEETRTETRDSEVVRAFSAQVFDKNGDPVPGVAVGSYTMNVLPANLSLKDSIRYGCPDIMSWVNNRQQHAPPYPLLGWLSPSKMRAASAYDEDTVRQFKSQFLTELQEWRNRMAAAGLHDNNLDRGLAHPEDTTSMRVIVEKALTLSRDLPPTIPER
jgi:hypothetical protein